MYTITVNNKNYEGRNLEEQVQKNKEDIAKHYAVDRVLADFGIKIVGQVADAAELSSITGENYGDAYAVGVTEPYSFYIWTRANNVSEQDYWFDIGQLAIVGPQGPQGEQGEKGDPGNSTKWTVGTTAPVAGSNYKVGDLYLNSTNGNIFSYNGQAWTTLGNIRGPQGVQGVQGPEGPKGDQGPRGLQGIQGPAGGYISIRGIIDSTDQLPSPSLIQDLTAAYLLRKSDDSYDLYIQVGANVLSALWTNIGPYNVATAVYNNGIYQIEYEMNQKQDILQSSATINISGNQANLANNLVTSINSAIKQPSSAQYAENIPVWVADQSQIVWQDKSALGGGGGPAELIQAGEATYDQQFEEGNEFTIDLDTVLEVGDLVYVKANSGAIYCIGSLWSATTINLNSYNPGTLYLDKWFVEVTKRWSVGGLGRVSFKFESQGYDGSVGTVTIYVQKGAFTLINSN